MVTTSSEFAYREALRAITQQQSVLESLRTRAVAVFATATAGSGFIAGAALEGAGWEWLAGLAFAFYFGTAGAAVSLLVPRTFHFNFDPLKILDGWKGYEEAEHYEHLARFLDKQYKKNDAAIENLIVHLQAAIALTVGTFGAWFLLAVVK